MGASTYTLKNRGCCSTHSTHTNEAPVSRRGIKGAITCLHFYKNSHSIESLFFKFLLFFFRTSKHETSSEDMFAASQNIESAPSTQSSFSKQHLSGDSTKISSPGSFQRLETLDLLIMAKKLKKLYLIFKIFNYQLFHCKVSDQVKACTLTR